MGFHRHLENAPNLHTSGENAPVKIFGVGSPGKLGGFNNSPGALPESSVQYLGQKIHDVRCHYTEISVY